MLSLTSFRLIISMILTSQFNAHKPCQSFRLVKSCTAIASSLFLNFISPTPPVTAASFQEQLAVVKALQLDEQKQTIKSEIKMQSSDDYSGIEIVRGLVYLLNSDTIEYPFGLPVASSLDPLYSDDNAMLILTMVGKDGPPAAGKSIPLKNIKFPFPFQITTNDLMFPYTAEAWVRSPNSKGSLSVTCILDTDGLLVTPSTSDRFGYAISSRINTANTALQPPEVSSLQQKGAQIPSNERSDVRININLKSDGQPYSPAEIETLTRVDNELRRLRQLQPALLN